MISQYNLKGDNNHTHLINTPPQNNKTVVSSFSHSAFTIVELLVVIVVIAILATITVVIYTGVTNKAAKSAVSSEVASIAKQLELYKVAHSDSYPSASQFIRDCTSTQAGVSDNLCYKTNASNEVVYAVSNDYTAYTLTLTDTTHSVSRKASGTGLFGANTTDIKCPTGFIAVPGSTTYGTSDFCVMKYEAKNNGSDIPVSTASGTPWVSINQTTALTKAQTVENCTNCHLISEAEWMTIAQNVLSVDSNWSGNAVGSGAIYRGHSDNNPANSLEASTDDTNGYVNTGNSSSSSPEQRRTLTLTNGEVIWDLAGNVAEWTSGQISGANSQPQAGTSTGYNWKQWNTITSQGSLQVDPRPKNTGITGNGTTSPTSWTSNQGIGQIYDNPAETALRGFVRGGYWSNSTNAGVLFLGLNSAPSGTVAGIGFRVVAPAQ